MKFDTVIIGGGLSGLASGIRLTQKGQKCVIISSGQSALHFFSGSFDLLSYLPDGTLVNKPTTAIQELEKQAPHHPYVKLGESKFAELAQASKDFFSEIGIETQGNSNANHYRMTPMGYLKPTWLTLPNFIANENGSQLPWKKATVMNIDGFLDFQPNFIAEALTKKGIEATVKYFNISELDIIRRNPSEFRSINLARVFDEEKNRQKLIDIFIENSKDSEAILLPACIGLEDSKILPEIITKVGKPIYIIPTLPPSMAGIRTQLYLREYYKKLGGIYMLGDDVVQADLENPEALKVYTKNHGNIPFTAKNIILATGSFFSQGLIADKGRVYEPIFNLDIDYSENRSDWYQTNLFDSQKYQEFGVKTDSSFHAIKEGSAINNLYVSGAILNGFNPIKEGSGAGVSLLSALCITEQILK